MRQNGGFMYKSLAAAVALSTAAIVPTVAFADDAPKSDITITGNADITTQYRLRGISQTDNDAAIQGGITVSHSSGFYLRPGLPTSAATAPSAVPTWNST